MDDHLLRPVGKLLDEGWNYRKLQRALSEGSLVRTTWGIYGSGDQVAGTAAHLIRARALLMRHGASVVLSHTTAAIAHGLAVEVDDPPLIDLTVPPPARGRRRPSHHIHVAPLEEGDVTEVNGLRVTSLARTAADLARTAPFAWGVVAMDQTLRRGVPMAELRGIAEAATRRSGVETLRNVLAFADGRAQSPAESVSRVTMARAGLPKPELQFRVTNASGWVADSDFGWPDLEVVGEVDGEGKYDKQVEKGKSAGKVVRSEQVRDELIRQAGWWPSHWGWALAWDVHGLSEQLRGAFDASKAWRSSQ